MFQEDIKNRTTFTSELTIKSSKVGSKTAIVKIFTPVVAIFNTCVNDLLLLLLDEVQKKGETFESGFLHLILFEEYIRIGERSKECLDKDVLKDGNRNRKIV